MTYGELIELAHLCAKNAYVANTKEVAAVLWKMAADYRHKAGKLKNGKAPDIGKPPPCLTG